MINQAADNVRLTDEQTRQLDEWKSRLNVIHDEVRKHEKILADAKLDLRRADEEKAYKDGLMQELDKSIGQLEERNTRLTLAAEDASREAYAHRESNNERDTQLGNREQAIEARETILTASEEENGRYATVLARQSEELDRKEKLVEESRRLLQASCGEITKLWS